MGVEFFEEKPASSNIKTAAAGKQEGFAASLVSAGMAKSFTIAQAGLVIFGLLCLFGAYFVFSVGKDSGARPPTQAEIQAMAALLKK